MIIIRKYFSEGKDNKEEEMSDEEKLHVTDQGIVGGTATALIGGGLLAGNRYLVKKGFGDAARVKNMKKVGLIAVPIGTTLAGISAYQRHKLKKKKSSK